MQSNERTRKSNQIKLALLVALAAGACVLMSALDGELFVCHKHNNGEAAIQNQDQWSRGHIHLCWLAGTCPDALGATFMIKPFSVWIVAPAVVANDTSTYERVHT
jgi:hypothetical protein